MKDTYFLTKAEASMYKNMAVELTNVTSIPDQYLGHTNLAFEGSQSSIHEMSQTGSKASSQKQQSSDHNSTSSFRRSNWTYPNISIDNDVATISSNGTTNGGAGGGGRKKLSTTIKIPPGTITYSWNDINVTTFPKTGFVKYVRNIFKTDDAVTEVVASARKGKQLLKNVNGALRSGELICILGSSGAGKTTLLNILTFQSSNKLNFSGERYLNGELVSANLLASVSAYIQQQDLFVGTLTVREHLIFHALLRMHKNIPYERRMERVAEVIEEFGLSKCVDTVIGIPGRIKGISGGEQKRLAFASEILTDPSLLFCDEPTSGLDSFMAQTIVQTLKAQAGKGKGILCTIHQPSSALFTLFDKVLVMAEGRVAYFGPTTTVLDFLKNEGYPCPPNYNPAEFLTQTLAIQPDNEVKTRQMVTQICDGFEKSAEYDDLKRTIEANSHVSSTPDNIPAIRLGGYSEDSGGHYKASRIAQFRAVLWRSWISFVKDPFVLNLRILQTVALALIVGCVYWDQKLNQDGVQNVNGAIFLFLAAITYQNAFGVVDVFCTELPVFLREHFNGMYRTDVYFIAKIFAELPFYILFPAMMVCISYYMIGLNPEFDRLLYTIGILILITNVSTSFGYFLSCLASTVTMALILAPALIFPFFLFGGFFMNASSGPVFLRWLKHISWFYYGYESLAITQWEGRTGIVCNRSNATCPPEGMTGEMVLDVLGFDKDNFKYDIIALGGLVAAFQVIAFLALLSKTWRRN